MIRFWTALLSVSLGAVSIAETRPNILFIMVDDLGYGDLSSYGATDLKSPHIDQLMAEGMRFDEFYANCPVCSPTRASFVTGMYPDNAGVPGVIRTPMKDRPTSWGLLRNDVPLLPAVLTEVGYHTALVGKWHLGLEAPNRPHDRGFDLFHGWLGDMMDDYYEHKRHGIEYMRRNDELIHPEGHATDLFSSWAVDYIEERETAAPDEPWFLFLAYNAPHTPIQPPQDWFEKVKAREDGITDKRAKLVALIEHMDHGIGQVVQALEARSLREETLIVFTSDNGGQVNVGGGNGSLRGGKQEMWEGGLKVSTCVVWPGQIKAGARSNHLGLTMDFYPTLAKIGGAKFEHQIDGVDFSSLLLGSEASLPERPMFWVRLEGGMKYGGLPYHAARVGDWKLLRNTPFEPYKLFNVGGDPSETTEVPREKAPKKYNELFGTLMKHVNMAGKVPWQRESEAFAE